VTQQIAAERGFSVDEKGFQLRMEEQRARARASWKGSGEEGVAAVYKELVAAGIKSSFVGYGEENEESEVCAIILDGKRVSEAGHGTAPQFVTRSTPFYGESGGQVGDTGIAVAEDIDLKIVDTKRPLPDLIVHHAEVQRGTIREGMLLTLAIDDERRQRIRCNHTTTHLLHRALREVLGEHVKQSGSSVDHKKLRFDFSHFQALSRDELSDVEHKVNDAIRKNYPVITYELSHEEALARGALAFFGEKYGERVRMIDISGYSRELCGGTHVSATGEIGMMKILGESSVAAGVRRIEAVTGLGASKYVEELEGALAEAARVMKVRPVDVASRAAKLAEEMTRLERELKAARSRASGASSRDLMGEVREAGGIKVLAAKVEAQDRAELGSLAERYRDKLGSGVVALACEAEGKVVIIVAVSKDLNPKVHAGKIVQELSARVGGKGGGRPDFAQGGGTDAAALEAALKTIDVIITGNPET